MMDAMKENKFLNAALGVAAVIALVGAAYTVVTGMAFKEGVDGLFWTMMCLLLALVFGISPLLEMRSRGWLKMKRAGETAGVPNGLYLAIPGEDSAHGDAGSHTRLYLIIWGWLIALTAVEVVLGYIHLSSLALMLVILMGISIVKAALIMAYFMHLKSERMSLVLTIVPAMVVVISLLAIFFPDSLRALNLRAFR